MPQPRQLPSGQAAMTWIPSGQHASPFLYWAFEHSPRVFPRRVRYRRFPRKGYGPRWLLEKNLAYSMGIAPRSPHKPIIVVDAVRGHDWTPIDTAKNAQFVKLCNYLERSRSGVEGSG